jgi:hypothetical protein
MGRSLRKSKQELDAALDELAGLFEFGHIQVASDPVGFMRAVIEEIKRLRAAAAPRDRSDRE